MDSSMQQTKQVDEEEPTAPRSKEKKWKRKNVRRTCKKLKG
jgi:hypothetical protein